MSTDHAFSGLEGFWAGAALPSRWAVLNSRELGQTGRDLAAALFDQDLAGVRRVLAADRAVLLRPPAAPDHDMLIIALATADVAAVDLLLAEGAPVDFDGTGRPLVFALHAAHPVFAHRLLQHGAAPQPVNDPTGPMRTAIALNSLGAAQMLLEFGASARLADADGVSAATLAAAAGRYRIAALLADGGAGIAAETLAGMAAAPHADTRDIREEQAARDRLLQAFGNLRR